MTEQSLRRWPQRRAAAAGALVYFLLLGYAATVDVTLLMLAGVREGAPSPWWAHALAVCIVGVTVEPARRWLRRGIDDLIYGHHDDAYHAVTLLHRELDGQTEPSGAPLATTIARAVNLPFVAVVTADAPAQVSGELAPGTDPVLVPLVFRDERIGDLQAGPRRRGADLTAADLRLLRDLADQVAISLVAARAAREVLDSRAQLVTAREEERRRIRNDLHDGLGPTLASFQLQLTAVQRLLPEQPDKAETMITDLLTDVRSTTGDIRRLVYALRPPLLDEHGLVGALRDQAAGWSDANLLVEPQTLPDLPAAVEVALYRIATEALHNAAKHSGARNVRVQIEVVGDQVRLSVSDDGRGLPAPLLPGVGLAAMRERAAELGGEVTLSGGDPKGTVVVADLPLREDEP